MYRDPWFILERITWEKILYNPEEKIKLGRIFEAASLHPYHNNMYYCGKVWYWLALSRTYIYNVDNMYYVKKTLILQ